MRSTSSRASLRRPPVLLLLAGALLVAGYYLLKAFEVGKIGAPSDIGGGLILVLAAGLMAVGAISLVVDFMSGRGERPHQ